MTLTDWVLILFILTLLAFAIYDDVIMAKRKGATLLTIPLLRRSRVDGADEQAAAARAALEQ